MHRHSGTDSPCRSEGRRGRIAGCAAALTGGIDQHPERVSVAASRDLRKARGPRRDRLLSLIEADAVAATEAVAAAGEASPAVGGRETPQAATQSPPNKRPPATVARHAGAAAGDGTATASKGLAQQCGSASSSSRDSGSPSKTDLARRPGPQTRRRARQLPSFPLRKKSRGAIGAASAQGVPRGPALSRLLQARW